MPWASDFGEWSSASTFGRRARALAQHHPDLFPCDVLACAYLVEIGDPSSAEASPDPLPPWISERRREWAEGVRLELSARL